MSRVSFYNYVFGKSYNKLCLPEFDRGTLQCDLDSCLAGGDPAEAR